MSQSLGYRLDVWCDPVEERVVLRRELASAPDDSARAALILYELGRIALSEGHEVEAAQFLLRAYSQRPQFRPTLRLAREIYGSQADAALSVKLLDAEARATRDHLTRAHVRRQQARLLWSRQNDLEGARIKLGECIQLDPSELASSRLLELLCALVDDSDGRITLVERQLEMLSDDRIRAALRVDLALLRFPLEPERSIALLQGLARDDGSNPSFLLLLEQLLDEQRDGDRLAVVLEQQADHERADMLWKGSLLARAARLARERGDSQAAVVLFLRSAEVDPYPDTLADCFSLLVKERRYEQAVEVGEHLFHLLDAPPLRAALACELGDYCRLHLERTEAATDWYHRCLLHAASYQPALEGLSLLFDGAGNLEGQLRLHQRDLAGLREPGARAHRLFLIATLLRRLKRDEEALELHREALAIRSGFLPSALALEELLTRGERWSELIAFYEGQLPQEQDLERVVHLLETMAGIWAYRLQQPVEAIACYLRIIERVPSHLRAIDAGARLCEQTQRWQQLVEFQQREVGLTTDGQRKAELLERTGEVWEYRLFDLERAIECYQRALECSPEYLPALRALGRLYRQKGRWSDLIAMHRAELQVCDDAEHAVSLLCTIAEVYEEELLDEQAAAQAYREILLRRPGYRHAIDNLAGIYEHLGQWRELVSLREGTLNLLTDRAAQATQLLQIGLVRLRRLGEADGAAKDFERALRLDPQLVPARIALEQLLWVTGATDELGQFLQAQLAQTRDGGQRATVARQLALQMELADEAPEKIAAIYERALEDDDDRWIRWSLARLYRQLDKPDRYAIALEQLAEGLDDDQMVGELELQIAQVKEMIAVGDPVRHYSRALQLGSGRVHAQRALERLARQTGQDGRLAESLRARINRTADSLELACLYTELAQMHEDADNLAAAEQAFRTALIHSNDHLSAIWGLGRLFEREQRWAECADLAEQEAELLQSTTAAADAFCRAGRLAHEKLADENRALALYKRVIRLRSGHPEAYATLHAILTRREDWNGLASLIRAQIGAIVDEREQAVMFAELGYIYLDRLEQPRKGEACLRRVIALDPDHFSALTTLGELYVERCDWGKAEAVCTRAVQLADHPESRGATLRRLGVVYRRLGRPAEALSTFHAAADVANHCPDLWLLRQMSEVAQEADDPLAQVNALDRLADLSEAAERIRAGKRVAMIAEERLDDEPRAVRALQQVLVLDPLDLEAIERLAAIYRRAGNRSALAQHLQAAVAQHRLGLARLPLDSRLYRQLARIFHWQRQFDRYYCLCVVLDQLGALGAAERQLMEAQRKQCAVEPVLPLPPPCYDELILPPSINKTVRSLISIAAPALLKTFAQEPASVGFRRSARTSKHARGLRDQLERFAGIFDQPISFDLRISDRDDARVEVFCFGRPTVVVGSHYHSQVLSPTMRFQLGRALGRIAEPLLLLPEASSYTVARLVQALVYLATGKLPFVDAAIEPKEVESLAARLSKGTTRKLRRQLALAIGDEVLQFDEAAAGLLYSASESAANRVGLVLAADLSSALTEAKGQVQQQPSDLFAELCQYVVSDAYFTLRERAGLALPGQSDGDEGRP